MRALLFESAKAGPYEDEICRECTEPKVYLGMCARCAFNPQKVFERLERKRDIEVTPDLHQFCLRLFELEQELDLFGNAGPLSELERGGLKVLKQERAKFENYRLKNPVRD